MFSSTLSTWNHTNAQAMARNKDCMRLRDERKLCRDSLKVRTMSTRNCQYHRVAHLRSWGMCLPSPSILWVDTLSLPLSGRAERLSGGLEGLSTISGLRGLTVYTIGERGSWGLDVYSLIGTVPSDAGGRGWGERLNNLCHHFLWENNINTILLEQLDLLTWWVASPLVWGPLQWAPCDCCPHSPTQLHAWEIMFIAMVQWDRTYSRR